MKKNDFLKKWAKRASGEKSVEEFERDVEGLVRVTVRASVFGITRGIRVFARKCQYRDRTILETVAKEVPEAIERALMKLNGIEEEEGGNDAQGRTEGLPRR